MRKYHTGYQSFRVNQHKPYLGDSTVSMLSSSHQGTLEDDCKNRNPQPEKKRTCLNTT